MCETGACGACWYRRMAARPDNWMTGELRRALMAGDESPEVIRAAVRFSPLGGSPLGGLVRRVVSREALQGALNCSPGADALAASCLGEGP